MTNFVLIPGLLSDHRVWSGLQAVLPGARTLIADTTCDNRIPQMAARALQQCDGEIVAIGHSMGGRVAMEMAHQSPSRIKGLVLANTGYNALQPGERERRQEKIDQGFQDMHRLVDQWLPPMVSQALHDSELYRDLHEMALSFNGTIHEQQLQALMHRPDASAYLAEITCPVMLVAADEDGWSPVAQHEAMQNMLPHADLAVIRGAGHFAPCEKPDEFARLVSRWLENIKGA